MSPKTCPICQTAIPENAPGGFCPVCLLRDAGAPCPTGRDAPAIEEIAAAFPQLEILELIGQGGMGFVYKARQSHLDRTVALKILAPELQRDPSFAERFAREARALGKLRHPNIVTLHEHGENGGFFYLLMEYVDGVNLRQAMAAGRFTPEQALAVVPPICDALQSAHAQGVWHRDIKPENILLDRDGRVKIADFGIARIASDPVCNFTLTFTGHTLGSAAYMAPEQHENPRHVDHRADIYSLGVVIYEMLTGELPLGRFPAPSQRAEVNERIDEIVLRTLEKERELRQQSADEVKTDVTSISSHASPPQRKNVPLASPASGKRLGAKTIFFLCAGSLALGCAAFFLQAMLSKRPEERLQDSPPLADHGTKEQPAAVSTANDWKIDTEKLVTPEREGWAPWQTHIKEGNMRALQRDWRGASASYLEGLAVAQKRAETSPSWQANVAESYRYVGDATCAMGDLKGALRNYQAGVAIYEKLLEKTPADSQLRDHLIEIHVRAGDVLKTAGDAAGALQSYRDGVAASEKLKKGWETEYPLGRREDALARNYQAAEVLRLIDTPNREPGDLMWMIGQAGAEKDDRLRPLLARKNLREDSTLALSLAGYDYSLNGNQNGLDFILANLSKQQVGADVNEVFVLAFLDEWDRSIKAVNSHFLLLDGAGGDCKNMFWARRMLLFPRNYLVYKGKAGDGAPLPASKAVSENAQDDQAGLPLSLEVRPNDPELLQKRSNAEVMEVGLQDPRSHVIAWNVLRQRAEAGQFSRAEAGELIGKLTSWLRRDYPDGFWDTLWVSSLLQVALERHLISDDETLDFLQAFYAGVHIDPFPRLRAGNTVQMKGELRNVWHDDMLGIRLLNQVTSITVDGKAVGLKHRSNKNGEGQSGWLEDYDTKLLVAGLLPGKHRVRCEIDSALVAVADCGGMEPNDPPAKWPATKRRWQRTHELDLTIYAQDAELVKLSDDPALNPLKPAELSAKPIVIRPGKDGLVAAVSLNSKKSEGVPYSVKVALKLGGKTFPCGSFWFDGEKESGSENSSDRLTFAVDIGALDSGATEAEIVLSPNPKGIEASPGVDRIWGQDIVFEHVPLERLDGTDPTAAIEARLQKKYGPNYLTWSPALEALPNARLIQVASENPAEAGSIWGILKMRLEEEKLGANEANDLMAKLTEWLRRIQPDGYRKQNLIIMEEFLFALHRRHLVLEPQTTAYLRVLHGDGEVTAKNYLHDQIVRFGCGMGGAWHRDVWFGFKLLREFRSATVDGKPVEVRGSKRRGMMNGAGFPGEFSLADLSPGKHLVRFEVHSALVAEQDAAGLSGDAPTAEWPPARLNWDGNLEAELVIPSEAQNPDGKPNEPVLTPLKTKPQEQTGGGGQSSETGETPEAAMEELLKAAHDRNGQVFVSRLSRSMVEMLKKEGSDPSKNFGDFDRVRLVEAKTTGATTAEVVVQSTDTSTPKQRGTLRMTLEDERWKLSDIGN